MGVVRVLVPRTLVTLAGGERTIEVEIADPVTLGELLDRIEQGNAVFVRRLRDETGAVRRYVNVYLDGTDVRALDGALTVVRPGHEVQIIQSVAGG